MKSKTNQNSLESVTETHDSAATDEKIRLCRTVLSTLERQYSEWKKSSFLDRPMMPREFTKLTEMSIEDMISTLTKLEDTLQKQEQVTGFIEPLRKLGGYWRRTSGDTLGNGHTRPNGAESLADMIANEAQKTLFDDMKI